MNRIVFCGRLFSVFSGIALAMGVILLLSEIWRRITFRYISDVRRRRQFLLLRRIVIGFCMGIVLILGFVSEFSSLATFAGFITAGLAVGLQTILLSVAAYFFLVGRWGIRVGDRISVAGVTGDVVDVGLVRLYLMELAGTGVDLYPTGRIVVFSNSVLFQATTPLFKQLPGAEYAWHEVAVRLNPSGQVQPGGGAAAGGGDGRCIRPIATNCSGNWGPRNGAWIFQCRCRSRTASCNTPMPGWSMWCATRWA